MSRMTTAEKAANKARKPQHFIIRGYVNHYAAYRRDCTGHEEVWEDGWDYAFRLAMMLRDRYPGCTVETEREGEAEYMPKL